ncbi:uroporphyrinogen-III synthase [Saccharopolyspora phatthalungensis]|uniref:Uroporphyrinogen-III synthase n=1 Tax=Saccharopolyspora phatthalungensis TaxID=664693 RepID=A0A840QG15_9PSEU|nr:uroporphyrinogen-III synthase [Saccharopolyspora phatthalungensis]MBB5159031.1 uroporphyrinogen-III synthase [Saccharopolyspora phatthalungensis]
MAVTSASDGREIPPLSGFAIGVTASRRAEDLGALFIREGARIQYAPAIRFLPFAEAAELHAATRRLLRERVDAVVATTGIGFRGWMEAADGWGLREPLLRRLRGVQVLARGEKARFAVCSAGLQEQYSPASESAAEMVRHLLESGVDGRRIAVQLCGSALPDVVTPLREAGAEVVEIPVYRWAEPADPGKLDRLLDAVLEGSIDALPFTSAPAAKSMFAMAERTGRHRAVVDALKSRVVVSCVGPITARPFAALGIPTVAPARSRVGALVRVTVQTLRRHTTHIDANGTSLELRGQAVVVDGRLLETTPAQMAVLRALATRPGWVISRSALAAVLPGGGQEHAVESAISRLRTKLGRPGLVQTVTKRGYRLAVPPASRA